MTYGKLDEVFNGEKNIYDVIKEDSSYKEPSTFSNILHKLSEDDIANLRFGLDDSSKYGNDEPLNFDF